MNIELLWQNISGYVMNLGETEITILAVITVLLVLFLIYRLMGLGAAAILAMLFLIGYIFYANNLLGFFKQSETEKEQRMKSVEEELER